MAYQIVDEQYVPDFDLWMQFARLSCDWCGIQHEVEAGEVHELAVGWTRWPSRTGPFDICLGCRSKLASKMSG